MFFLTGTPFLRKKLKIWGYFYEYKFICGGELQNNWKTGNCSPWTYMVYSIQKGDENDGSNIFAVDGENCGIDRKKR